MKINRNAGIAAIVVGVIGLVALGRASGDATIPETVYQPYTKEHFARTFDRFGEAAILGPIQSLREAAAEAVAARPACDDVAVSELSDARSVAGTYVVYVDCENGQRFYYTLAADGSASTVE